MIKNKLKILLGLIKFRLSLMVAFSALAGYFLAASASLFSSLIVFIGVFFMAGGSCALNQYQEKNYDAKMPRTRNRPIPSGNIKAGDALLISVLFILFGYILLLTTGKLPAILGIINVILYNFIYTPLKTKTSFAILPGALVGAVPPIIGWTSAGNYLFEPQIMFIAIFMFLWQMPHFWLLLISYGKEYENAGFSSISNIMTEKQIKFMVFLWTLLTSVFIFFFPLFELSLSFVLLMLLTILNILFILFFYRIMFGRPHKHSIRKAFVTINSFMLLVLIIFIINLVG